MRRIHKASSFHENPEAFLLKPASILIASLILSAMALSSSIVPSDIHHGQKTSKIERFNTLPIIRPGLGTGGIIGRCQVNGTLHLVSDSQWIGDTVISKGTSYVIGNRTLSLLGTVHVDGGTLIIRNATITRPSGGGSDMWVWNAGCVEFTDTMLVNGGQLWVGCGNGPYGCGASCCQTPDNSTVYVNSSTSEMGMPIIGSNVTVKIEDTIWGNGLGGGGAGTKVEIHDSLVMSIALNFDPSLNVPIEISGLHPGHFSSWDLRRDLSVPMMPWDLTLSNVTVVPNTVGPGPLGRYLGWEIFMVQGSYHGPWIPCSWPKIIVRNSVLAGLGFIFQWNSQWCSYDDPVVFSGIPSIRPLNATYFNSIQLTNSTVNGQLSVIMRNLNMTFVNVPELQLQPYYSGKSHLTFINSTLGDGGLIGCECLVSSMNSRFGSEHGGWEMINQVPYHDLLPLYDTDAASYGGGGIVDSKVTITGDIDLTHLFFARSTVNRFYPLTVYDVNGAAMADVKISVSSQSGAQGRWWTTDPEGKVVIPVWFNDGNWTALSL
jgi:hypothetical protein